MSLQPISKLACKIGQAYFGDSERLFTCIKIMALLLNIRTKRERNMLLDLYSIISYFILEIMSHIKEKSPVSWEKSHGEDR